MDSQFSERMDEFQKVLQDSKAVLGQHSQDCDPMWAPLSCLVEAFDALYQQSFAQGSEIGNLMELKRDLIDELEVLSEIDGLTGLWNQSHFVRGLDHEIRRASRSQRPISLMLIEIDCFSEFSSHYGHSASELLLKRVGSQLSRVLNRPYDIVARFAGEQFSCLLPETNNDGAMTVSRAVVSGIGDLDVLHEVSEVAEVVTVSIGLLTREPERGERPEVFTDLAQGLLDKARDSGRNLIVTDDQTPPR